MARKRNPPKWERDGYASEYQYRKAKAKAAGYSGYTEQRRVNSLRETGLTPSQRRTIRRRVPIGPLPRQQAAARNTPAETRAKVAADVAWMHDANIVYAESYGGIHTSPTFPASIPPDLRSFNQDRRIKRASFAEAIRQYDAGYAKTHPGYVRDYYDAFVNPDSNYEHFQAGRVAGDGYYRGRDGNSYAKGSAAFRQMVLRWAPNLRNVQNYMNAAEFQARYGTRDFA